MIPEIVDTIIDAPQHQHGIDVESLNRLDPPPRGHAGGLATSADCRRAAENDSSSKLSVKQLRVLNALLGKGLTETIAQVAERAGVSPRTIYRYMIDHDFITTYRELCKRELSVYRGEVTKALIKGACTRGPAQPAMQKLYYERLGEPVVEHEDIRTHSDSDNTSDYLMQLSIGLRRAILDEVDAIGRGEDVTFYTYQLVKNVGPQQMLRPAAPAPPKQATPLDEIELKHSPCD
jgi:hypothetical protein